MEFGGLTIGEILELVKKIGPDGIRGILRGDLEVVRAKFLVPVYEIRVDGIERFDAATAFGPGNPAGINFELNFAGVMDEMFLRGLFRRVYENTEESVIEVHRLIKDADFGDVFEKLGTGKNCIRLAHLYKLIEVYFERQKWLSDGRIVAALVKEGGYNPCLIIFKLYSDGRKCQMWISLLVSSPNRYTEGCYFLSYK
jgi:hypothetical protein